MPFLKVIFLGFVMGVLPGPIVTALFAETLARGWRGARRIVVWAAAGELLMSVSCVAALSSVLGRDSPALAFLSAGGALVMLHLARDLWWVDSFASDAPAFTSRRVFLISCLNGMAWIFWVTVCTPAALALEREISGGRWLFIALFEGGWAISTSLLVFFFSLFRPLFRDRAKVHLLYRSISILFVAFAVKLAVGSVRALLQ